MANKKFSDFDLKTNSSDVAFVVGFNGTDNVRITPANLTGGGGASDLNGLTDCLVDTDSLYIGESPGSLSGNPQGNTALGIDAANALTSGTNNTFIGNDAGLSATTANDNVLIGYRAGKGINNTSKQNNVAIGSGTFDISAGQNSVVIGYQAGRVSSSASAVYIGYQSGWGNSGGSNTGVGYFALNGGGGSQSVGIGYETGRVNSATGHISIGYQAGYSQTSGTNNTNVGYQAGYANTTGGSNTNIGYQAGNSITSGSNLTVIGYDADASSSTATNEITLGNSSVATLRCAVTSITSLSDERDKSEIKDLEYGLAFIDALQPREFVWDNRPETQVEFDKDGNKKEVEFYSSNKGKKDFGFIAQEVRELDNETLRLVYTENEDKLELSYGKLVPILVKAIQELKEEVELLKS